METREPSLAPMRWDSEYRTGDMGVDMARIQLVAMVNDLTTMVELGMPTGGATDAVFELLCYLGTYLAEEEAFIQAAGCPCIAEHRQAHRMFTDDMARATTGYFDGTGAAAERLLAYIRAWLEEHSDTMDRSLAEHLRTDSGGS